MDIGVLQLQRSERLLEERLQNLGDKAEGYGLPARFQKIIFEKCKSNQLFLLCFLAAQVERRGPCAAAAGEEDAGKGSCRAAGATGHRSDYASNPLTTNQTPPLQALRLLRSRKQVEKRVDNLSNQLESIKGILDRIDQSKTDKMVRGGAPCVPPASSRWLDSCWTGLSLVFAGHPGIPSRCGGAEALPEGRHGGIS